MGLAINCGLSWRRWGGESKAYTCTGTVLNLYFNPFDYLPLTGLYQKIWESNKKGERLSNFRILVASCKFSLFHDLFLLSTMFRTRDK